MRTPLWVGGTLASLLCYASVSSIVTAGNHLHRLSGFLWWLSGWLYPDCGNGSFIQEPVASQSVGIFLIIDQVVVPLVVQFYNVSFKVVLGNLTQSVFPWPS